MRDSLIISMALAASFFIASPASASSYTFQAVDNAGGPAFKQLSGIKGSRAFVDSFGNGTALPNKGYPIASTSSAFNIGGTTLNGIHDQPGLAGFYSIGTNMAESLPVQLSEPSTLILLGTGLLGLAGVLRKRLIG